MTSELKAGKYRHTKSGKDYYAMGVGKHSENLDELVVYKPLYEHAGADFWLRPLAMFLDTIELNGSKVNRFEYLGEYNSERLRAGVGITIINKKGQVLLGKRIGDYQTGLYAVPAGHIQLAEGEGIIGAAQRKLWEEMGLRVSKKSLNLTTLSTFTDPKKERTYVNFDFVLLGVTKEPKLKEPEATESWKWFDLNKLPKKKEIHPPALLAINAYKKWKKTKSISIF